MLDRRTLAYLLLPVSILYSAVSLAQVPLAPPSKSGLTVTPVYEGWYRNPDGTANLSFGYFNRNYDEIVEVPIGEDNFFEPGPANRGQPTSFQPRRHWGVFAVNVPADFGYERLVWTLKIRGETFVVPGSLNRDWEIDALKGEAGSGNTPPVIQFKKGGPAGSGPAGIAGETMTATVSSALPISVWVSDDGKASGAVRDPGVPGEPVTLSWFKHQGPGSVEFSEPNHEIPYQGGEVNTTVTFSAPGAYVLRVRANDASGMIGAGYAQCCWTNGFVTVNVTE